MSTATRTAHKPRRNMIICSNLNGVTAIVKDPRGDGYLQLLWSEVEKLEKARLYQKHQQLMKRMGLLKTKKAI